MRWSMFGTDYSWTIVWLLGNRVLRLSSDVAYFHTVTMWLCVFEEVS